MSKIKIRILIENGKEKRRWETTAIYQDKILKYQEEDKTKVILNLKDYSLTRENNEMKMSYLFQKNKETIGTIKIKEYYRSLDIKIKTIKLERKNNNIEIKYIVENEEFLYKIEEIK